MCLKALSPVGRTALKRADGRVRRPSLRTLIDARSTETESTQAAGRFSWPSPAATRRSGDDVSLSKTRSKIYLEAALSANLAEIEEVRQNPAFRRGLYGLREIRRYLAFRHERPLSDSAVARWAVAGLSVRSHTARHADYSFLDLISLLVVRDLVNLGLPLRAIRNAEAHLRERLGVERPFASINLTTDRVDIFYEAAPTVVDQLTAANRGGQEVLVPAIRRALRGVRYDAGVAASWSPTRGIVLDPTIQFGEPCVSNTRITTTQLAELARYETPNDLARLYRLKWESVREALEFEDELAQKA